MLKSISRESPDAKKGSHASLATLGAIEPQQPSFIKVYPGSTKPKVTPSSAEPEVNLVSPVEQELAGIKGDPRFGNFFHDESKSFAAGDMS